MPRKLNNRFCFPPYVFLSLFAVIALFPLLIILTSQGIAAEPRHGGHLTVALEYRVYGFDAIKSPALPPTGWVAGSLIMERLFESGENGELIPVLGVSVAPSADQTVWTVKLRRDVKFHDGTLFNADAVVTHWQRILNPENRYRGLLALRTIDAVKKVDPYTVEFHLKHPWKAFLPTLTGHRGLAPIIPSPKAVQDDLQNRTPVGTGPFIFKEWKAADRIVVTRNPHYWRKDTPYLDEITIRIIPDHEARYAALVSGGVDMIYTDRPKHINKLTANPGFHKITAGGTGAIILLLNTRKPPLNDIRVRRALAHGWDQKAYLKASLKNTMPYVEHWYDDTLGCDSVNYRGHDITMAKTLIADYGQPVEVEYLHSATPRGRETMEIVQQMFAEIGVTVKPIALNFGGIMKQLFSKQYNMASWLIPGMDEMGPTTRVTFHSKSPFNLSGYSNEAVDALLIKQSMSLDQSDRQEALCEVARIVNDEVPFLYLFGRKYHLFAANRVQGVPSPRNEYIRLANVWLTQ